MLDENHKVKIIDFGLAQQFCELVPESEVIAGSPGYIAPEVFQGISDLNFGSRDLFSLGAIMYFL